MRKNVMTLWGMLLCLAVITAFGAAGAGGGQTGAGGGQAGAAGKIAVPSTQGMVSVSITGGHDTDPRDHGRPVALVAGALGVTDDVFRDAFSHVKPASQGQQPDPAQVQQNKKELLDRLGQHGVTNDRLDEVSNQYRYQPGKGKLWKHRDAVAWAKVENGVVTQVVLTDPGCGYTSAPLLAVDGVVNFQPEVTLGFGSDLKTNGSIKNVKIDGGSARTTAPAPAEH